MIESKWWQARREKRDKNIVLWRKGTRATWSSFLKCKESQIIFTASEVRAHRVSPVEILHLVETPIWKHTGVYSIHVVTCSEDICPSPWLFTPSRCLRGATADGIAGQSREAVHRGVVQCCQHNNWRKRVIYSKYILGFWWQVSLGIPTEWEVPDVSAADCPGIRVWPVLCAFPPPAEGMSVCLSVKELMGLHVFSNRPDMIRQRIQMLCLWLHYCNLAHSWKSTFEVSLHIARICVTAYGISVLSSHVSSDRF